MPSLDNTDFIIIEKCLKVLIKHKNMKNSKNRIQSIIDKLQNGVETNNKTENSLFSQDNPVPSLDLNIKIELLDEKEKEAVFNTVEQALNDALFTFGSIGLKDIPDIIDPNLPVPKA